MRREPERPASLYDAVRNGHVRAVDSLIVEYLPRLRAFVRSRSDPALRQRESCSDLVQSVCCELLERSDGFEFRGETQFRAWLFTSALNLVRQKQRFHRARKRDVGREVAAMTEVSIGYASIATPSRIAAAKEQIERLEAAFDSLSDEHREVIALARIAELPFDEVGERMHRSAEAARKLLGRALLKLGAVLEAEA